MSTNNELKTWRVPSSFSQIRDCITKVRVHGQFNDNGIVNDTNCVVYCLGRNNSMYHTRLQCCINNNHIQSGTLSIFGDKYQNSGFGGKPWVQFTFNSLQSTIFTIIRNQRSKFTHEFVYQRKFIFDGKLIETYLNSEIVQMSGKFIQSCNHIFDKHRDSDKLLFEFDPKSQFDILCFVFVDLIYFFQSHLQLYNGKIDHVSKVLIGHNYNVNIKREIKLSNIDINRYQLVTNRINYSKMNPKYTQQLNRFNIFNKMNSKLFATNQQLVMIENEQSFENIKSQIELYYLLKFGDSNNNHRASSHDGSNYNNKNNKNRSYTWINKLPALPNQCRNMEKFILENIDSGRYDYDISQLIVQDCLLIYRGFGTVNSRHASIRPYYQSYRTSASSRIEFEHQGSLKYQATCKIKENCNINSRSNSNASIATNKMNNIVVDGNILEKGYFDKSYINVSTFFDQLSLINTNLNTNAQQIVTKMKQLSKIGCLASGGKDFDVFELICKKIKQLMNKDSSKDKIIFDAVLLLIQEMQDIFKLDLNFESNLFSVGGKYNRQMIGNLFQTKCIPFIQHFMQLGKKSMNIDNVWDWITKLSIFCTCRHGRI